ncbi:MAG: CRISPR-associated protein Cas5 [Archaeoglobus sp.]|uniref:CRISPR-associated protein Cas5 n=1 Tax=Archaeoglobus sp. TaxID=1872626 RepID=UPI001D91CDAA|nr:CRISPR-associated protein Cas5 [Archaeoglobus sp.]MBO8179318.1 CRISPR-associated protein Cas5 [Archaeoglobus sp.]
MPLLGLKFRIDCPYFATFREPTSTSLILTYVIPPYTTIRGVISNALGLSRDDLRVQNWFKIGIKSLRFEKSREMAKILKLKGTGRKYERTFPSSPMFREFLVEPSYEVYLVGDEDKIRKTYLALLNPARPLYLGGSDDLVDLDVFEPVEVEETETKELWSVVGGVHEGCVVEKVPYKFVKVGRRFDVVYKTVSIPVQSPVRGIFKTMSFGEGESVWMT